MPPTVVPDVVARESELDRILREGRIYAVYQPIVELTSGEVVAFEALARVRGESPLARPDLLFDAARAHGRLVEVDWACREAALRGAVDHGLRRPLFLNCEPEAAAVPPPERMLALLARAEALFRPTLEITERGLSEHPQAVLEVLPLLRERGLALALDDVGVDPRSVALMPIVCPDVVKLDLRATQGELTAELADVIHAVNAHAERTGAMVIAEGIETEAHRLRASALGATHGQGWYFGRPGALPAEARIPATALPLPSRTGPHDDGAGTPFAALCGDLDVREGPKALLIQLSRQLETHASSLGESGILLATFQHARHFSGPTRRRYEGLGRALSFVGALGEGIDGCRGGVRATDLAGDDPLAQEWDVCLLGPHFAGAFVARDLGSTGPDAERRFAVCVTYDRERVARVARRLMARIAAPSGR
ncbi:MAG: EAL domain-containing protein [Solirubrobacteraceae bacterium]|nr:EAL domain-containing protein [Solirubrobacteraceae bacterium]